ncbi:MAG: multicopper oxidase domain-containing protein [Cyanobacteria bacterium P01_F01_bin.143]
MTNTDNKTSLHFSFMRALRSHLGNLSYVMVIVFLSVMLWGQPARADRQIGNDNYIHIRCANKSQIKPLSGDDDKLTERSFQNPPFLEFSKNPKDPLILKGAADQGIVKKFDLSIQYTDSKIYNPATKKCDNVRLRSYVGTNTSTARPFVAPVIEINPGDTIRVNLTNNLPYDDSCINHNEDINNPHCFNGSNLHTHGLWISPTGNSDNVLLSINPGVKFQYEYNVPPKHPAGTFWYHPHRHGSTALQVSSGMAGALIIRGDRLPSETDNGDIDTLLKRPNGNDIPERILVLQQIQYYCLNENGRIKINSDDAWVCDSNDTGVIESYTQQDSNYNPNDPSTNRPNFGPGSWSRSGRYTSINGLILPKFRARAGKIQRWRMIHAGVRDTINLEFRKFSKFKEGEPDIDPSSASDDKRYIAQHCTGEPLLYHVIADDGLTRAQAWPTTLTTLQPGYRSDALVIFPEKGKYCVINAPATAEGSLGPGVKDNLLLGTVRVKGREEIAPDQIHEYLTEKLVDAARENMPASIAQTVIEDLNQDLKLTKFIDHPDITKEEVTGRQELAFNIDVTDSNNIQFEVSNHIRAGYDPQPYNSDRIDRDLILGGVDEWILQSRFVGHPFHIHVNPFQIIAIFDPDGNDVSAVDATDCTPPDENGDVECDPEYPGLKGVWKDTLWIKGPTPGTTYPQGVYTIVLRTRYQRYIGEFVLHCHILDHEDQGMMQNIRIVLSDGSEKDISDLIKTIPDV